MQYRVPSTTALPPGSDSRRASAFTGVLLLLSLTLAGCGTTAVQVTSGDFPAPVVDPMPLQLGVHFTDEFRGFRLEESVPQRGDWAIDIGVAQVNMLMAVLPGMFERVVEVDSIEPGQIPTSLHAVLVPEVKEMQFAIPFQTRSNFFEVWIRYEMRLLEPSGDVIASWPVTAYGKTRSLMLETAEAAIRDAAINALRDAGAFLAIGFPRQEELRPWLERELAAFDASPRGE